MIFILPPKEGDLADRIAERGRGENAEVAKVRLNAASREVAMAWQHYEHMVINADIDQAINEVKKIQTYESWKKENMKQLMRDFINEYEDLFDSVCKAKYKSRKGVNSEKSN